MRWTSVSWEVAQSRWAVSQRDAMKFSEILCSSVRRDWTQWGKMYLLRNAWPSCRQKCEKANFHWNPCRNVILSWKWGVTFKCTYIFACTHLWHTLSALLVLCCAETRPTCSYSQLFITHNASECMNTAIFILYKIFKHTDWKSAVICFFHWIIIYKEIQNYLFIRLSILCALYCVL